MEKEIINYPCEGALQVAILGFCLVSILFGLGVYLLMQVIRENTELEKKLKEFNQ